jgi:hypothetical protein
MRVARFKFGRSGGPADRRSTASSFMRVVPVLLLLLTQLSSLHAQSITIYNDGRVLVRRSVPADIPKGESSQKVVLGQVDPSSIFSTDSLITILAANYDGGTDYQSVLRRSIGRKLLFRSGKDTVSATVLGVDPERYRMADGTVAFSPPGVPLFPEELVVVDPVVNLGLKSSQSRKALALGYFTGGASWQASYQVLLGSGSARVTGMAVIGAGTLTVRDAEVQLLAGSVAQAATDQFAKRRPMAAPMAAREEMAYASEQKVGEFHLYTLPGKVTLLPGVTSSTALFEPANVSYTKGYEVTGNIPYWGGLPQYGDEEDVPVQVTYVLQRPRKTDFGDRPIPGGVARLFEADSGGRLQLVGEAAMDHIPAGEDLRLGAGEAFDLKAKRVQTNYTTKRDSTGGSWRTVATADYRVTVTNAADRAASVDVIEVRGGEWSVVSSSVKPEKLSSTRTRFRIQVPAAGKATLTYRVRVIW